MQLPLSVLPLSLIFGQLSSAYFYSNKPLPPYREGEAPVEELEKKWGSDLPFTGIQTLFHLPHIRCLNPPRSASFGGFDIGILGLPLDTSSPHRTGSRFGPRAVRSASSRPIPFESLNTRAGLNPFLSWAEIVDCGDVPVSPFDASLAARQVEEAVNKVLGRQSSGIRHVGEGSAWPFPKLISLGGGREVLLPILKALEGLSGTPVAIVHFGAHGDGVDNQGLVWQGSQTWSSLGPDSVSDDRGIFELASSEGLIDVSSSVLAGLRGPFAYHSQDNNQLGFLTIDADDIDVYGAKRIAEVIVDHVGPDTPAYISVDISVIDPGTAPGTGMPEPGGWTMREMIQVLRGVEELNVVGAAILEVNPAYDDRTQSTALAGSQIAFEILTSMVKNGLRDRGLWDEEAWRGNHTNWKGGRGQVAKGFERQAPNTVLDGQNGS